MKATAFSDLSRKLMISTMFCGLMAGCSSVEYTSQAELTAVQTVVPTPRPGESESFAAVPVAQGSVTQGSAATGFAEANGAAGATALAAAMPQAAAGQQIADATPTAYGQIPLTPEMTAIQSVIPMPRPTGPASPATQLAFAGTQQSGAIAALTAIDTRPRAMTDLGFDTSGPTDAPAAQPMFDDSDDGAPTVQKSEITKIIDKYSRIYEVPASLLHRVVRRESRYNPKAYNKRGFFGLMQIKYNTAKSMGYAGAPAGLFDAETNIKYAAKYLRGAWVVSDAKEEDAVKLYARGYYYDAKRKGLDDIAQGTY